VSGSREAVARIGADTSALDRALGRSKSGLKTWASDIKHSVGHALHGAFEGLSEIAGLGGVAAIALIGHETLKLQAHLDQVRFKFGMTAAGINQFRDQLEEVATAKGVNPELLLAGTEKYASLTHDVGQAREMMEMFGDAANVSGASVEQLGSTAATLRGKFGITEVVDMKQALSSLYSESRGGGVTFAEMADHLGYLAPRFSMFGTTGAKGVAELGALFEVMRKGTGSTEEAAGAVSSLMSALLKPAVQKQLKHAGIKLFDVDAKGVRHLRDLSTVLFEIEAKTKGDPGKLAKMFGRPEPVFAMIQLAKAGKASFDSMLASAMGTDQLGADAKAWADTATGKINQAKQRMETSIAKLFTPERIDMIAAAVDKLSRAIQFLASNPGLAIAGVALMKFGGGGGAEGLLGGAEGGKHGAGGGFGSSVRRSLVGATVGYGVGSYLNRDWSGPMATLSTAALTTAGALGPLGNAAGLAGAAIAGLFEIADARITKENKAREDAVFGKFGKERMQEVGTPAQQAAADRYAVRKMQDVGAITADKSGTRSYHVEKLKAALEQDPEFKSMGHANVNLKGQLETGLNAYVTAGLARTMAMAGGAPSAGAGGGGGAFTGAVAALTRVLDQLQRNGIAVRAGEGIAAVSDNDPSHRRGP
jgi:hypothetical protein